MNKLSNIFLSKREKQKKGPIAAPMMLTVLGITISIHM